MLHAWAKNTLPAAFRTLAPHEWPRKLQLPMTSQESHSTWCLLIQGVSLGRDTSLQVIRVAGRKYLLFEIIGVLRLP